LAGATSQNFTPSVNGNYRVEITVNDCMLSSTCQIVDDLAIDNFDANAFSLCPNPTTDNITISYTKNITSIQVFDPTGRIVKTLETNSKLVEINLTELPPAMYMVRIVDENKNQKEVILVKN
jgi:Secretion system C-terminal sorting domain